MKLLLDLFPALAFFGAYHYFDIYTATVVLVVSLFVVVLVYRARDGKWHKAHLATALIALVLGSITLYVHDPAFIKLKPTVVYTVFAMALLGSHFVGEKVLLARIPQTTIQLPDSVWRKVNFVWAIFFLFCAVLNFYIAHNYDEDTWVKFKSFGFTALMFVFMIAHAPFLMRYIQPEPETGSGDR